MFLHHRLRIISSTLSLMIHYSWSSHSSVPWAARLMFELNRGFIVEIEVNKDEIRSRRNHHLMTIRGGDDSAQIQTEPCYKLPYDSIISDTTPQRALILMDQFTPYHGGYLSHKARKLYNTAIIHVFSNYVAGFLHQQAQDDSQVSDALSAKVPLHPYRGFPTFDEANNEYNEADITESDLMDTQRWKELISFLNIVGIVCESDSGLDDAERFGVALGLHPQSHDGFNQARRDKYLMNQCIANNGLRTVKQKLCYTEEEAIDFAKQLGVEDIDETSKVTTTLDKGSTDLSDGVLGSGSNIPISMSQSQQRYCVIKPRRGVASDDVHLCSSISSVRQAFQKILGSIVFASTNMNGNKHDCVLVQEFAAGTEYAIDVVSKNGHHKIAALWRYDKRPVNGAPFVYHATELVDAEKSPRANDICQYVKACLDILGIRWGMTHNEVIVDDIGPRLVEVNCRQHNTDFAPLTTNCVGYNALDLLLAAYLGSEDNVDDTLQWDDVPDIPSSNAYCAIVHLVSHVEGIITEIRQAVIELISNLPSVSAMEIYPHVSVGSTIRKTVDITTDIGWIHIINSDEDQFKKDYQVILDQMSKLLVCDENNTVQIM